MQIFKFRKTIEFFILCLSPFILIYPRILLSFFFFFFIYTIFSLPLNEIYYETLFNLDSSLLSTNLSLLTLFIIFVMLKASYSNLIVNKKFILISLLITNVLILSFKTTNILTFYFIFERRLIPIFLIILGWGYQPERLLAGLNLFIYTVIASLPLLVNIISFNSLFFCFQFKDLELSRHEPLLSSFPLALLIVTIIIRFLVKYPIFFTHLWLPKAHVEAPVAGSIILAAILLKLGGYGIIRCAPFLKTNSTATLFIAIFSLLGGVWIRFLCLRQTDIKVLIAYSSVAHIRIAIIVSLQFSSIAFTGAFLIIFAHGVVSSGIFAAANLVYRQTKTRNILLAKRLLSTLPLFTFWWFFLCAANIGVPPTLNLIREILSIIPVLNFCWNFLIPISLILLLTVAFNLLLFARTQQSQINIIKPKFFRLTSREICILISHRIPPYLLICILNFLI